MKNREGGRVKNGTVTEDGEDVEYSDGSRRDGVTAAATTKDTWYLGEFATIMDAEMLGVAMAW